MICDRCQNQPPDNLADWLVEDWLGLPLQLCPACQRSRRRTQALELLVFAATCVTAIGLTWLLGKR